MMSLQVTITSHVNPNAKSYILGQKDQKMSESLAPQVFTPPFKVLGQSWYGIGIPARKMLSSIFREVGSFMTVIFLRPEELLIVKKEDADWDKIDSRVIEAIKEAFAPKTRD